MQRIRTSLGMHVVPKTSVRLGLFLLCLLAGYDDRSLQISYQACNQSSHHSTVSTNRPGGRKVTTPSYGVMESRLTARTTWAKALKISELWPLILPREETTAALMVAGRRLKRRKRNLAKRARLAANNANLRLAMNRSLVSLRVRLKTSIGEDRLERLGFDRNRNSQHFSTGAGASYIPPELAIFDQETDEWGHFHDRVWVPLLADTAGGGGSPRPRGESRGTVSKLESSSKRRKHRH